MILKICGITNPEDADAAISAGATALGFNFYPRSPRYIAPERAAEIVTAEGVRRVGVFVNEARVAVERIARIARVTVAQLHGDEIPSDYPREMPTWKAVRVIAGLDFSRYENLPAEALLLDGPAEHLYGGSGKTFDWRVVSAWEQAHSATRIILAGGLDASNVAQAVALAHPWGVDACSRIERAPGRKDHIKMTEFLKAARAALSQ